MGSSRHPVNPVKLSQPAFVVWIRRPTHAGHDPMLAVCFHVTPDRPIARSILLDDPALGAGQIGLPGRAARSRSRFGIVSLMETAFRQGRTRRMETSDKCEDL
jgi:hypothetical protein